MSLHNVLKALETKKIGSVFKQELLSKSVLLNLSAENPELKTFDCLDSEELNNHINAKIKEADGLVGVGGYLENRDRYQNSELFQNSDDEPRSVHLAVDLWAPAGTEVFAPLAGTVHSFNNNANYFDYGPTIILEHEVEGVKFHTLYGHLSVESLDGLSLGKEIAVSEKFATLGDASVNGDWPPHLHFQVIKDMQGKEGDYPGVAAPSEMPMYKENCPDPNLLLRIDCI